MIGGMFGEMILGHREDGRDVLSHVPGALG